MLSLDVVALGVPEMQAAHEFYTSVFSLGNTDRGQVVNLDLHGTGQLALCGTQALANGVDENGTGFRAVVFNCKTESREEVDALLTAAASAGGQISVGARETESSGYSRHFTDPDGFLWKVAYA